jgi:hypothetical protein
MHDQFHGPSPTSGRGVRIQPTHIPRKLDFVLPLLPPGVRYSRCTRLRTLYASSDTKATVIRNAVQRRENPRDTTGTIAAVRPAWPGASFIYSFTPVDIPRAEIWILVFI